MASCVGAFAGTFWSAFLLWFIGRAFLRTRFSYLKAVEVVALAGSIVALGAIFNALLIGVSGDPATRPALSFFARHLPAANPVRLLLDTFNFFHLWTWRSGFPASAASSLRNPLSGSSATGWWPA